MAPYVSQAQRRFMHSQHPAIAAKWDKEFPNQKGLPEKKHKKKAKIVINNKLRGDFGAMDPDTNKVEINVKSHKGDKRELASTIKHELLHVKNPKMTEKEVYKRSAKTKIQPQEQHKLLAKLRHKMHNYKVGAIKRKLKFKRNDKVEPGDLFNRANAVKRTAIMGLI